MKNCVQLFIVVCDLVPRAFYLGCARIVVATASCSTSIPFPSEHVRDKSEINLINYNVCNVAAAEMQKAEIATRQSGKAQRD